MACGKRSGRRALSLLRRKAPWRRAGRAGVELFGEELGAVDPRVAAASMSRMSRPSRRVSIAIGRRLPCGGLSGAGFDLRQGPTLTSAPPSSSAAEFHPPHATVHADDFREAGNRGDWLPTSPTQHFPGREPSLCVVEIPSPCAPSWLGFGMASSERKLSTSLSRSVRGTTPARLQDLASTPESPRTPLLRSTSSLFGSPGGGFRTEDEYLVLEIGSRFVRGGFPGESGPRCTLPFGPDEQRRVRDYRQWDPAYSQRRRKRKRGHEWGQEYELYRQDLSQVDLGLVADRFERAMREAYNKYFLLDPKPRRILLALPPRMPHALMSTVLEVLFGNFQAPSIMLMSSPVLSTVAAGLRSGLVVDIGWAETTVTGVCEYREVHERRTVRAGKLLSEEMAKLLNAELNEDFAERAPKTEVSFEEAEEVLTRVGWCKSRPKSNRRTLYFPARTSPVLEEFEDAVESPEPVITIPFPRSTPPTELTIPFASLAKPAENALFAPDMALNELDDHELPLHHLIYRALLSLPVDVRRLCMSRIIITGGVSNLPGLKTRILAELDALVQSRGWDPVRSYGSASARHEAKLRQQREDLELRREEGEDKISGSLDPDIEPLPVAAGLQDPVIDPIDTKLAHLALKNGPPAACFVGGTIRGVETLGAWAGASLVAQLRIKGIVEMEREKFLQHGLMGASREKEVSVVPQRQSMGPGVGRGAGERASWTLGVWA
ncbi:actin-domain-containing protein [Clohesyomyces aquaticus]|uniref:Actin-domain-containing protein n=1 Tax=Clohesyomyces aquaticus TaxID=1231657 RepID=A0A1Y1Y613_9PLEO|nr:actin-domain-containing protein [Clohesyomyces aquaticus]